MANRHHRKRRRQPCATRWRRLLVEQFEPRTLLASAAPIGFDRTINTLEDTPYVFQASDFPLADPFESPAPNSLQAVRIASLPLNGLLLFDNQPVIVGQFISTADFNVSQIRFFPALNASGPAYANFTFQVQDNGGTVDGGIDLDPTPNTITINVTPVNDPPFGPNSNLATLEDTPYLFRATDFGFSDPFDDQANQLASVVITSLPTSGTLRIGGTSLTASNLATAGTIFVGSIGQLTFAPASNSNDSTQPLPKFAFRLRDNGGTANGGVDTSVTANTITISVTSVNDAPFSADRSVTTLEDTAYTFTSADFTFSDFGDTPSNSFKSIKIATLPQRGTLTNNGSPIAPGDTISFIQIVTGNLVFSPAANGSGVAYDTFTFRVQDNGGTANGGLDTSTFPSTLSLNVTPVNDPPSGSDRALSVLWSTARTFDLSDFGQSDANDTPQNDLQAVVVRSLPQVGTLLLNGSTISAGMLPFSVSAAAIVAGQFKYQAPQTSGVASFQFQLQDSGGTANGGIDVDPSPNTLTLITHDVHNNAPGGQNKTITTPEDVPYAFRLSDFPLIDFDGDILRAVKVTTLPIAGTLFDNGSPVSTGQFISAYDIGLARFTYVPPANVFGSVITTFRFQVQDDGDPSVVNGFPGQILDPIPRTMTINVTPTNDPPSGVDQTVALAFCGYPYVFRLADFPFTDPLDSPGDMLRAVKIVTLPFFGGALTDNGVQVTAGQFVPATDIAAGKLVFTPTFTTSSTSDFQIQLQDTGGTANGGVDLAPRPHSMSVAFTARPLAAPEGLDQTVTTLEDTPYVFHAADFPIVFGNAGDQLVAVRVSTLPIAGVLRNNSVPIVVGQYISVADLAAGLLSFSAPANAAGAALATFTFQVQDNSGICGEADLDPTPKTLTINVLSVNDAPFGASRNLSFSSCSDFQHTFSPSDFGFSDPNDNPANNLKSVRLVNTGGFGALTLNGFPYTNNLEVSFTSLTSGSLVYTASGTTPTTITFVVKDDGGTAVGGGFPVAGTDIDTTARVFNIAATLAPNTAPAGIASMVTTNEDTPYVFKTSDFPFIDAENNSLKSIVIGSPLPQMGVLRLFNGVNFVDVMPNQRIDAYDLNLGRLRFDPLPVNSNSSFFASILFKIQDDGGNCNGASDTDAVFRQLTIRVPSVNDPPEGSNKSIFISNGQPYTLSLPDFPISDPNDSPFNHLAAVRIMSLPMGGTLTNARTAVAAGQFVTLDDIVLGNLIYTPPAAGQPAGILTFIVQDDGGTANGGVDRDPTPNSIYFLTTPNHPPEGTDRVITINEDNSAQLALADFPFTDPGEEFPNNLQSIKIVSLPTTGQLLHFGQVISVGQFIGAAELSPGSTALVYQPAANESGSPYANFSFQLQDDGGTAGGGVDLDPTPNTVVFNVTPVNDPPFGTDTTISAVDNSSLSIRSSYFGFDDQLDNPPNALRAVKFVTLPAFGNLELDGEPVNVGQFVAADDMDAGLLKFVVPRADESLVTEFRFILQDDGGTANGGSDLGWSPNSLRIQVHSYCNLGAPYFSRWTAVTAMEDQPYTFNSDELGVYDIYGYGLPSPQGVIIQALPQRGTLLNNGLPILAGQAIPLSDIELGRIQFVGSRDTNGAQSASFTLKVLDPVFPLCGDTGKGTVTVDVLPVNDAPSFAKGGDLQSHDLDGPRAILGWAKGITLGPADEVAQKVKFEAISDHSELFEQQPQFDLFGNLSFQPKAGASGRAVVSVVLIDDGGTANGGIDRSAPQSFTIDILYSHPLHNRVNATDVTGDGHTFAEDALEVINYINAHGSGPVNVNLPSSLQSLTVTGQSRPRYYDVTADDNIAPDDVMAIINYINARPAAEGEASSPHSQNSADSADESLFLLLAADAATQLNRRK